jgi:hypothetical protein
MKTDLEFISIGSNRVASCSAWGKNNLFAYAGHKFVVLYEPNVRLNTSRVCVIINLQSSINRQTN